MSFFIFYNLLFYISFLFISVRILCFFLIFFHCYNKKALRMNEITHDRPSRETKKRMKKNVKQVGVASSWVRAKMEKCARALRCVLPFANSIERDRCSWHERAYDGVFFVGRPGNAAQGRWKGGERQRNHDGATVFLTDRRESNYGCLILTLQNFAIDIQINLPVLSVAYSAYVRALRYSACMLYLPISFSLSLSYYSFFLSLSSHVLAEERGGGTYRCLFFFLTSAMHEGRPSWSPWTLYFFAPSSVSSYAQFIKGDE